MKSRLHKIEIRNFKAFREFTLTLRDVATKNDTTYRPQACYESLIERPLRAAREKLRTLETVRIIEGKA